MQAATRRNSELTLLILALIVGAGAVVLVALARGTAKVQVAAPYVAVVAVAYIVAHVVVRRAAPKADSLILPVAAVVNTIGIAAIYRLSPRNFGPLQVNWAIFGIVCFIATLVFLRDYRIIARYKYIFGFVGVGLLLLPATPLGQEVNGAQLWLDLGAFSFQPGELAKLCLVIFFASYLAERKELLAIASRRVLGFHVPDIKHFGPLLVMWGVSLAVMFWEKDLGSSLLFFSIFIVMLYIGTARLVYVALGGVLFGVGAFIGYQIFGHVQDRIEVWFNALDRGLIRDEGFQLAQSWFAFATGGLFGTGLGRGRPDLIPAAETDFIFSVIGEELGLLGTAAVLLCFVVLVGRGLKIALDARNDFAQLLAAGLIAILAIQTIVIIAGVTRLLPLTGITLPFLSYGGSSLISNFILIALLLRISNQTASEPEAAHTGEILVGGRR